MQSYSPLWQDFSLHDTQEGFEISTVNSKEWKWTTVIKQGSHCSCNRCEGLKRNIFLISLDSNLYIPHYWSGLMKETPSVTQKKTLNRIVCSLPATLMLVAVANVASTFLWLHMTYWPFFFLNDWFRLRFCVVSVQSQLTEIQLDSNSRVLSSSLWLLGNCSWIVQHGLPTWRSIT